MPRVKRGVTTKRRHKKLLAQTKGFKHGRKNIFRLARQALIRAKTYSYRDRRVKKRDFRSLWIIRINAAARTHDLSYRAFMHGLSKLAITLDRKTLAHLAAHEPKEFEALVNKVKAL
ncbi:50S ribosomal protein L20 [Candidatus Berkelbacteria bacterium]|uniref:Large ribosomal subunit protein bL20 n=1 Tax=Candidatus Berkelbacteria bacterium CG10_big_fil_rev_8_21_14_0_10_43_14 TaxID=1974515 RepID=A0A2M6RA35_9BACT|nr:50S ribosomal protein L20 [Candidatus Berkelbacteria bacterium]OIP06707.1 MAG: 50S ribosomal protein L20 [Candidatus Berkelbacteria bacterium CG2_30_43_20]PIS06851.1 MAG: 50S ribosomal protein L20 [Candidatus Berkelbacteria bacterium CG10_big_fil_rev_8_21_14_0_10_43_14]PIU86918.1 MAG: 50S ribosomal protein L20 [Candidatus Berkelbacteria bacterium CG06_land_8_20_14_3_00_43_10]